MNFTLGLPLIQQDFKMLAPTVESSRRDPWNTGKMIG